MGENEVDDSPEGRQSRVYEGLISSELLTEDGSIRVRDGTVDKRRSRFRLTVHWANATAEGRVIGVVVVEGSEDGVDPSFVGTVSMQRDEQHSVGIPVLENKLLDELVIDSALVAPGRLDSPPVVE